MDVDLLAYPVELSPLMEIIHGLVAFNGRLLRGHDPSSRPSLRAAVGVIERRVAERTAAGDHVMHLGEHAGVLGVDAWAFLGWGSSSSDERQQGPH
jgi:hypothetical protein